MLEIHSRKSQSHRTKTSEIFRNQSKKIMFSSDVSARGMDYPDVTTAVQVRCADVSAASRSATPSSAVRSSLPCRKARSLNSPRSAWRRRRRLCVQPRQSRAALVVG